MKSLVSSHCTPDLPCMSAHIRPGRSGDSRDCLRRLLVLQWDRIGCGQFRMISSGIGTTEPNRSGSYIQTHEGWDRRPRTAERWGLNTKSGFSRRVLSLSSGTLGFMQSNELGVVAPPTQGCQFRISGQSV